MAEASNTGPLTGKEYYRLRDELFKCHPRAKEELIVRCRNTGTGEITPDTLWRFMGDKPLYTNKSVIAGRPYEYAWLKGMYPDWKEMAGNDWTIERNKAIQYRLEEAYKTPSSEKFLSFKKQEGLHIDATDTHPKFTVAETPNSRLYAMHRFALWIAKNFPNGSCHSEGASRIASALHPDLDESGLKKAIEGLRSEIDGLWGPATLLHGLMDAGLAAVKPDQHLLYTVVRLNCVSVPDQQLAAVLDPKKAKEALDVIDARRAETAAKRVKKVRDPDNSQIELAGELLRKEKYLFKAVHAARQLAFQIIPCPEAQGKAAREVDIVLMRASYENTRGKRFVDTFQR
jgi:hypothetical protein